MGISYCLLGTYPPTQCGLATFSASLLHALAPDGGDDRASVVRVIDSKVFASRPEVSEVLITTDRTGHIAAAEELNRHDVAIVQHDFDIFGGSDGDQILAVLDEVRVPVIVVLHTIPSTPTPHQRSVLERIVSAVDAVVTMTAHARTRLLTGYDADAAKVTIIPHGAPDDAAYHVVQSSRRPMILTWGLLGPGKGIEWGLAGLREIRRLHPSPHYIVAGQTHPQVRLHHGEAYRIGLATKARALGVTDLVQFERSYLEEAALTRLIDRADVVLLPYDSYEQITSAVLVEAVAAHKPVVATRFPHAVELLSSGAGVLVNRRDGAALGAALRQVLTDPALANRMSSEAARIATELRWPVVADRYRALSASLLATRTPVG